MKDIYKLDTGEGIVAVAAESAERAKEMATDPALVEVGMIAAEVLEKLKLVDAEKASMEEQLVMSLMNITVLSEARVVAAQTSVKLFKDESIKLFGTNDGHYIIGAKDRDDALKVIEELAAVPHRDGSECGHGDLVEHLKANLNEHETPKSEFEKPPKIVSREVVEWYKNLPPPEPPMMPAPPYVM